MSSLSNLGTEKISSLIYKYSLPAIIAMLVNAVYGIVDRIFIGHFVGENALAGLTITFPFTNILFAFSMLIGVGAANIVSNKLGAKEYKDASKAFGTAVIFGIVSTIILCILAFMFKNNILMILGATPEIFTYAEDYISIILFGFVFSIMAFIFTSTIRAEGKPFFTMISMCTACIVNIIFDYLFIGIFGWGVKGAAAATVLGQFVSLAIVVSFYLMKKSALTISKSDFTFDYDIAREMTKIGFSSFLLNAGNAITLIFMNNQLTNYGGAGAIAAISVAFSIQTLVFMPVFGLRQGVQTIIGYNYGAKEFRRVYDTLFLGMKISGIFMLCCYIMIMIFPSYLVSLFLQSDSAIIGQTIHTIRLFLILLPFYFIQFLGLTFFQATGRGQISNAITIARQLIVIPCIILFPLALGLDGVFIATVFCDFLSISVCLICILMEYKKDRAYISPSI